jgi:hypothetical protein
MVTRPMRCRHAHVLGYPLDIEIMRLSVQQSHVSGAIPHNRFSRHNVLINLPNRAVTDARNTVGFLYS